MPLNEKVIGKKFIDSDEEACEITMHESIYYGLAVNEDNDAYFDNTPLYPSGGPSVQRALGTGRGPSRRPAASR